MSRVRFITDPAEIEGMFTKWQDLATQCASSLLFHQAGVPYLWWRHFGGNGVQFDQVRGRNFFGRRSWVEKFQLLVAERDGKLVGLVPLATIRVLMKGERTERRILSFCGDSVLFFYQDFLISTENREEILAALLDEILDEAGRNRLLVFLGHIPDNSPNLDFFERYVRQKKAAGYCGGVAVNQSRGGVYPWTLQQINDELNNLLEAIDADHGLHHRIRAVQQDLEKQGPALVNYPKTRNRLEGEIREILLSVPRSNGSGDVGARLQATMSPKEIAYPYLELPDDSEQFIQSLSSSNRYYFKRYTKKLYDSDGQIEHVFPGEITEQDLEDYLSLHLERWGSESVAINALTRPFHLSLGKRLAELDAFHLFFVKIGDRRVASHGCIDIAGRREYYFSGRLMDLGKIPAGKLLCYHTVLDAIDRGLDIYDFGYGGDDYKFVFTQTQRTLKSVVLAKRDELPDLDHLFTKFEYVEIE